MIIDYTAYNGPRNKTEISFSAIGCAKTFFVIKTSLRYRLPGVCSAITHNHPNNHKQFAIDFILVTKVSSLRYLFCRFFLDS